MGFLGLFESKMLQESASVENVTRAMDNHSKVIINYHSKGEDKNTGSRVIEPVAYGLTKAGNPVIRAYQPYGDTTSSTPSWKFFRLDRISYWEETSSKFDKVPDFNMSELNADGDETMSTVIKTYRSTEQNSATNAVNVGPKTKEKVLAQTSGDNSLDLGKRNLERMKGGIKIDIDNNKKVNNGFNIYTDNTKQQTSGPRFPGKQNNEPETNGSVENGDINQEELNAARAQVYGDYSHELDSNEYDTITRDNISSDPNQKRKDNRWQNSSDSRFLNRKNSGNRELYNMEHEDDDN